MIKLSLNKRLRTGVIKLQLIHALLLLDRFSASRRKQYRYLKQAFLFMNKHSHHGFLSKLIALLVLLNATAVFSDTSAYMINPGDTLEISVWNEDALKRELKVLPDGTISFPLAGVLSTTGKTVNDIQKQLKEKLSVYIEDPVVNVAVRAVDGNAVFVMGQVNKPGSFIMYTPRA